MTDYKILICTETVALSSDNDESSGWSDVFKDDAETSEDDFEEYDDDDDKLFFPLMQYLIRLRKKRVDDYLHIVDSWTELEFKNRLGLSKKTSYQLIGKQHLFKMLI